MGAPRELEHTAPWRWLEQAWADYRRAPLLCTGYGFLFVSIGWAIAFTLWQMDRLTMVPVTIGAFALVAPLFAAGLYAVARQLETSDKVDWSGVIAPKAAAPGQIAYFGIILLFSLLIWMLLAMVLYAIFAGPSAPSVGGFANFALGTTEGLTLIAVGTAVGGVIAAVTFALTAFSLPMLMAEKVDAITAAVRSTQTIRQNPQAAFLWAWIIAASLALGAVTLLLSFVVMFPLLGLATWHAYRDAFGSSS